MPVNCCRSEFIEIEYNLLKMIFFYLQEGFAQPDQENGNGGLDDAHALAVDNGNNANFVGGEDETY